MTKDRRSELHGSTVLLCALLLLPTATLLADDPISKGLKECSAEKEASARLACFDELSRPPQSKNEAATKASSGSAAIESSDDLGAESVRTESEEVAEALNASATVTKCKKSESNRYFFYFANGQVWRQTDGKRLKYTDCEFDVTITKDFFGYKMEVAGGKSRIRVTRVK